MSLWCTLQATTPTQLTFSSQPQACITSHLSLNRTLTPTLTPGEWSTSHLSLARQYFGAASATPDLAVFAGGFGPWGITSRLGIVDIYNSTSDTWSTAALSVNRSNLFAATVAKRYAAFGSGNIDDNSKMAFDIFDGVTGVF